MYWEENRKAANLLIEKDRGSFLFALENGAIRVKPFVKSQPIIVIRNSSYTNVHSKNGQGISLFEAGKLRVENVNYTRSALNIGEDMFKYSKTSFKKANLGLFDSFIDSNLFYSLTALLK